MRKVIALFTLFFLFIYSASSQTVFQIEETEKLSIAAEAEDADNDLLTYTYTEPLDANGEWQTAYGDAGEYESTVTVSDGIDAASEEIVIIVTRREESPTIESFSPEDEFLEINEGETITFSVDAEDLNDDPLEYRWLLNEETVSTSDSFTYEAGFLDSGERVVVLVVTDGRSTATQGWTISVSDVDVDSLFDQIQYVTVTENDVVSLSIPDFEALGLSYEISEPVGTDNLWQTSFDDAGDYDVTVSVTGKDYDRKKTVGVRVENDDRPPELFVTERAYVGESGEVQLLLEASDPDNDEIEFSVDEFPENSYFEGDTFIWMPDFDVVQKESFVDSILEKFRVLSRTKEIEFIAMSGELEDRKRVKIVVSDVNQPFELEPIDTITISEGEEVVIEPQYVDADGDEVTFKYSGYMTTNRKQTGFEDSGHFVVKVVASDGYYTQTVFVDVIIKDSNRAPEFGRIDSINIPEGIEAMVMLSASDPDHDDVVFSIVSGPDGAYIKDDHLIWKPGFDMTTSEREVVFVIAASDGVDSVETEVILTVSHVNTAPRIVKASNTQVAFVGQTTTFEVEAVDEDNDQLVYEWDFGFLDKHEGTNMHNRQFSSKGEKEVTVTVSDGREEVSKTWTVLVV